MNITQHVSISTNGNEGNGNSYEPSISAEGSYIAFSSSASNLVTDDANGFNDVFVYNRILNTIKRVSISDTGEECDGDSYEPSISGDGNFIAFTSYADNLVANDTNEAGDVFIFNQNSNTIKRVSISSNSEQRNGDSYEPSISADGRYIAFTSYADNLVDNDTNEYKDVFVHDQISHITERISITNTGKEVNSESENPSISADGRYVTFSSGYIRPRVASFNKYRSLDLHSYASNLVPEDTNNYSDIFLYDRILKTIKMVSVSNTSEQGNENNNWPSISADGSVIAFQSDADNLVTDDSNYCTDIFVHIVNNTLQHFSGLILPNNVKSGDTITINAHSENAANITALILNETLTLTKQPGREWNLKYAVPQVPDGNYLVLLTAIDSEGNIENLYLNFTVDNTPPTITGIITPDLVKSGNIIIIKVFSDADTKNMLASVAGYENLDMYGYDGAWWLYYTFPSLLSGNYTIILTGMDNIGNQGTASSNFTVDNTPPVMNATITPNKVKSIDFERAMKIIVESSPDTKSIYAYITGSWKELYYDNGKWILDFSPPLILDVGTYKISLKAIDNAKNVGTTSVYFTVYNNLINQPGDLDKITELPLADQVKADLVVEVLLAQVDQEIPADLMKEDHLEVDLPVQEVHQEDLVEEADQEIHLEVQEDLMGEVEMEVQADHHSPTIFHIYC